MTEQPRQVTPYTRLGEGDGPLTALAFAADGCLATAGEDGLVRLWAISDRSCRRAYEHSPSHAVLAMAFSADGASLVTLGGDGLARVWDARSGERVRALDCPDDDLREEEFLARGAMALSDDGALLATRFTYDSAVKVWETATGRLVRALEPEGGAVMDLAFVPRTSSMLAVLDEERGIRIWDAAAGYPARPIGPLPRREGGDTMRFSPDGRLVAAVGHHVGIWDASTSRGLVGGDTDDCGGSSAAAFSPDGGLVVTSGYSHALGHVWDLPTLIRDGGFPRAPEELSLLPYSALVTTLDGPCGDVRFSPDGSLLAAIVGEAAAVWRVDPPGNGV